MSKVLGIAKDFLRNTGKSLENHASDLLDVGAEALAAGAAGSTIGPEGTIAGVEGALATHWKLYEDIGKEALNHTIKETHAFD